MPPYLHRVSGRSSGPQLSTLVHLAGQETLMNMFLHQVCFLLWSLGSLVKKSTHCEILSNQLPCQHPIHALYKRTSVTPMLLLQHKNKFCAYIKLSCKSFGNSSAIKMKDKGAGKRRFPFSNTALGEIISRSLFHMSPTANKSYVPGSGIVVYDYKNTFLNLDDVPQTCVYPGNTLVGYLTQYVQGIKGFTSSPTALTKLNERSFNALAVIWIHDTLFLSGDRTSKSNMFQDGKGNVVPLDMEKTSAHTFTCNSSEHDAVVKQCKEKIMRPNFLENKISNCEPHKLICSAFSIMSEMCQVNSSPQICSFPTQNFSQLMHFDPYFQYMLGGHLDVFSKPCCKAESKWERECFPCHASGLNSMLGVNDNACPNLPILKVFGQMIAYRLQMIFHTFARLASDCNCTST